MTCIWFRVINHYYVPDIVITDTILNRARTTPNDNILNQISDVKQRNNGADQRSLADSAEAILKGEIKLPGYAAKNITMPFSIDDIDEGTLAWQFAIDPIY